MNDEQKKTFVNACIAECIQDFSEAIKPDMAAMVYLWQTFPGFFDRELGNSPGVKWDESGAWVRRNSRAMGHYAAALAALSQRDEATLEDVESAHGWISEQNDCQKASLGGWCSS